MVKKKDNYRFAEYGDCYILGDSSSVVLTIDTTDIVAEPNVTGKSVQPKNMSRTIEFVPRGEGDEMPLDIIRSTMRNITTSANLEFKTLLGFGEGVKVLRRTRDDVSRRIVTEEVLPSEEPQVFEWLRDNDYNRFIIEIINDLRLYSDAFVEYILDRDKSGHRVAQVRALETCFSRVSKISKDGCIEYHGYCADWARDYATGVVATPMLDRRYPLYDLKRRTGVIAGADGKKSQSSDRHFVQMLSLPSPGRFYYSHPYWWSVFHSGWLDFSNSIITFKKALIHNEMVPRHIVYVRNDYWNQLYNSAGAKDDKRKAEVKKEFLEGLDKFLAGAENAGTSIVCEFQYDYQRGIEQKQIIVETVDAKHKGGDYIEDSEESSNVLCYGMGVHSSILGNSPGKSKNINGTEARELFVIQQALSKYVQQLCVQPLYFVRDLNGWPSDLEFSIANLQLTTLDANSGAVRQIGISPDTKDISK